MMCDSEIAGQFSNLALATEVAAEYGGVVLVYESGAWVRAPK